MRPVTLSHDTSAGIIARFLKARGVERIFALCGGHIMPIWMHVDAEGIRIIDVRDERAAVYMAHAHSELTGRIGVALVTAGPGVTNSITGIAKTPALDISNLWRAAALPVGLGLMLLVAFLRLLSFGNWRLSASAVGVVAVFGAALYSLGPVLVPLGNLNLLIFFVVLVAIMVFAAVPIAFAFGLATFAYITLTTSTPSTVVIGRMDEGMSHLILLSVPLFVFLGLLIEMTGMARAMVGFLASLLGHVRGGLQYVLVAAMYLVSGISGAKAADMAAVAPVLFPEMVRRGAKPGDLVALLSATGAQTETIPPSLVLITIGSVTGVSIAALFTGGLLPGLVLAVMLCAVVWRRYRNEDLSTRDCTALRDPRSSSWWRCDRNRGVDDRNCLLDPCRAFDLSEVRLAPSLPDAN
jgi:hypothetical protein